MTPFFDLDNTKSILSRFKIIASNLPIISDFEKLRNNTITLVIGSMLSNPESWDRNCQINIEWISSSFVKYLSEERDDLDKQSMDRICAMCFRFLFEFYLSIKNDLSMEFESARVFVIKNLDQFHHSAKDQIEYALRDMPIAIFKQISNSAAIDSIKEFSAACEHAKELKEKWDEEINEKEKSAKQLSESLSKYKNAFNFVGLYQGFDELSESKYNEQKLTFKWLIFLAVLILTPILSELVIIYNYRDNISLIQDALIISILPIASFTIISIYYFRVLLFNYKSTKSQILQIDLRKTLCRFIQQYAEYSKEIKTKDHNPLDKFENIIFSGIVSDSEQLPSSYDGLDQILKLIKTAKA